MVFVFHKTQQTAFYSLSVFVPVIVGTFRGAVINHKQAQQAPVQ